MENASYIALSRQRVLRSELDTIAQNIANMNTVGFKANRLLFEEYLSEPDRPSQSEHAISLVTDRALVRDTTQGNMALTGNPFDMALNGEGYFVVESAGGPRYTRMGDFQLNLDRELVDSNGLPLLDIENQRIVIPEGANDFTVSENGAIASNGANLGQIQRVRFEDENQLESIGGGLYVTNQFPIAATELEIRQGSLESSNVVAVSEMTRMINIMRAYQSAQSMIDSENERQRTAIRRLGQAGA